MKRIQRQRTKGWRMPEGAIYIGRPSLWGNPWTVRDMGSVYGIPAVERAAAAVRQYRAELQHFGLLSDYDYVVSEAKWLATSHDIERVGARSMAEYAPHVLRGRDLVCWCRLCAAHAEGKPVGVACLDCEPCHADVLLDLSNLETT